MARTYQTCRAAGGVSRPGNGPHIRVHRLVPQRRPERAGRADGVFEYFGEGQTGDMRMRAGNRAIAEQSPGGNSLLLFRRVSDGVRFEGARGKSRSAAVSLLPQSISI
jgi:hypothetical protein